MSLAFKVFVLLSCCCMNSVFCQTEFIKTENDTILEIFNQCQCIAYFSCKEINRIVINSANAGQQLLFCSDPTYVCCSTIKRNQTEETTTIKVDTPETTTKETTISPIITKPSDRFTYSTVTDCGIPKSFLNVRILNPDDDSQTTIPGEVPWIVEIFQKTKYGNPPYIFKCGGSLIHPKVVLTATHCVKSPTEQALKIVATGLDTFQSLRVNEANERNVAKIITHPQYYSGGVYNDIALLILEKEYDYGNFPINSICLPTPGQNLTGKLCLAVGWGDNKNMSTIPLKKVDVPIVDSEDCQRLLRKTYLGSNFLLHTSALCAGGEEGKDTCKGDGGGPLICLGDNYRFFQAGIVSWGVGCGVVNQPGIYTNVAKFNDWIRQEVGKYDVTL